MRVRVNDMGLAVMVRVSLRGWGMRTLTKIEV